MGSGKSGTFSLGRSSAQEENDNSYYAIIIEKIKYIIYAILQIWQEYRKFFSGLIYTHLLEIPLTGLFKPID